MISTILVEHRWIPPVLLAALVLLGPPVGAWLVHHRRAAVAVLVASLVPLAALTLSPGRAQGTGTCEVAFSLPTFARVELAANVVLFVAPVLLAVVVLGRVLPALVAGTLLSVAIETVQLLLPGLGRACSTSDWLSNTIGAGTGAALGAAALLLARHLPAGRREDARPQEEPVSLG